MVSDGRQLLRVDQELPAGLLPATESELLDAAMAACETVDIFLFSDYAKGTLSPRLMSTLLAETRRRGIRSLVDPKGSDYGRYRGASVVTPNRKELETVTGQALREKSSVSVLGEQLRKELELDALLVKLSEEGMLLLEGDRKPVHVAARAREVFDVTGAGDTVLAMLGLALGAGLPLAEAAAVANRAAGAVVGKVGTAAVHWADLLETTSNAPDDKRLDWSHLNSVVATLKKAHRRIVFTNGCFDLLHPGHVKLLTDARRLGDVLFVGLNSDASVKRLKGESRPILSELDRAQVLGGLDAVDFVTIFEEDTPERLIECVKPDILVKGGDYTEDTVVGARFVKSYGGRIALIPLVEGRSTTSMVSRMKRTES
jgi:D-beta-D-heptose 7-phosphate kinase/D-beta-D-heptose 1-phosphate adenosyltransferase